MKIQDALLLVLMLIILCDTSTQGFFLPRFHHLTVKNHRCSRSVHVSVLSSCSQLKRASIFVSNTSQTTKFYQDVCKLHCSSSSSDTQVSLPTFSDNINRQFNMIFKQRPANMIIPSTKQEELEDFEYQFVRHAMSNLLIWTDRYCFVVDRMRFKDLDSDSLMQMSSSALAKSF